MVMSTNSTVDERLNGASRQPSNDQKFNRQPSKRGNFYRQPSKEAVIVSRQTVTGSFKSHCFSWSSRTAGSQRIFLTSTTSFYVPKCN